MGETLTYTRHALSTFFGSLNAVDFDLMKADIAAHGQRIPAMALGSEILDGWHRVRACMELGIEPRVDQFSEADDPVAFVKSMNLHRRHNTESQRALSAVQCSEWAKGGRPVTEPPGRGYAGKAPATRAQMAEEAEVSERTITRAKTVVEHGTPELIEAVRTGEISLKAAAAKAKPAKAKPAKPKAEPRQAEPDPEIPEVDVASELELAYKQITDLSALVAAAESDDVKAEAIKWRRMYEDASRKQGEAMDATKRAEAREAWAVKQLRRCGKAVGQEDPDKIAAAVEGFAREHKKVAA